MMTYRGASKALAEATRGAPWVPDYCRVPRCARWSRPDVSSQQLSSATSAARCDDRCTWDLGGICLLSITSRIHGHAISAIGIGDLCPLLSSNSERVSPKLSMSAPYYAQTCARNREDCKSMLLLLVDPHGHQ